MAGGGSPEAAQAAEQADVDALPVDDKHKALIRLCVKLTEHAYKITDEDIEALRVAGLGDDEILEGVFIACMFNSMDRLADTLGLYELGQLIE